MVKSKKILGAAGLLLLAVLIFLPCCTGKRVLAPLDLFGLYVPWNHSGADVSVYNHFPMDFVEQYLGERYFAWKAYRTEGFVGWNNLNFCGTAQYANTMDLYFNWPEILYRLLSFWDAWHTTLFIQILLAAIGMYIFLLGRRLSISASAFGGMCYAFNSFFFIWLYHGWMLGAFCWLPWLLWALYAGKERRRVGWLAPPFLALAFLGGHLQFTAFYVIILGAVFFAWIQQSGRVVCRENGRLLLLFACTGLIGAGLAAWMFYPCIVKYIETLQAGLSRGGIGYPKGILQPIKNLVVYPVYIFPYLFGRPQSLDFWKFFDTGLMHVPFAGSMTLILAGFFTIKTGFRRGLDSTPIWLMGAGLLLPLTPLVGPLYQRLFIIFIFGAVWTAACALDRLKDVYSEKNACIGWCLFSTTTLLWAAASGILWLKKPALYGLLWSRVKAGLGGHKQGMFISWWEWRAHQAVDEFFLWSPEVAVPWICLGLILFSLYRFRAGKLSHRGFLPVLFICTFIQLFWFGKNWLCYSSRPQEVMPLCPEAVRLRAIVRPWHRSIVINEPGQLLLFPLNTQTLYEIPNGSGYSSIVPNGMQIALPMMPSAVEANSVRYGALGVSHALVPAGMQGLDAGWMFKGQIGEIAVFTNRFARPVYSAEIWGHSVPLIPLIHLQNRRQVEIPEESTQFCLLENFDKGWMCSMDGRGWQTMCRSKEGGLRIDFPAAAYRRTLELRYVPLDALRGGGISLVVLVIYSSALIFASRRRRRQAICTN